MGGGLDVSFVNDYDVDVSLHNGTGGLPVDSGGGGQIRPEHDRSAREDVPGGCGGL